MNKTPPNELIHNSSLKSEQLKKIANTYGTPLYIYNYEIILSQWEILNMFLHKQISPYYSVKANPNRDIIKIFNQLGANFETASKGEIKAVRSVSKDAKIIFVGPCKKDEDLEYGLDENAYIVVESLNEIQRLQEICFRRGIKIDVALRINPGTGSGIIQMAGETQFGVDIDTAYKMFTLIGLDNIRINGLHFYLGTGVLDKHAFIKNTRNILKIAEDINDFTGGGIEFLDMGGGLGIPYYRGEEKMPLDEIQKEFSLIIDEFLSEGLPIQKLAFEAGRFLMAEAGVFLTTVVDVKSSYGKKYVVLDGGKNVFNIDTRYMGFKYTPMNVLTDEKREVQTVTVCGPLCTSSDRIASNIEIPMPQYGDIIAFYQAGAYGYTASPGLFLSHGFPKEILFMDNQSIQIRECMC